MWSAQGIAQRPTTDCICGETLRADLKSHNLCTIRYGLCLHHCNLRLPTWLAPLRNSAGMSLRSKAYDRNIIVANAVWNDFLGLPTPCLGRLSGVLVQLGCDVSAKMPMVSCEACAKGTDPFDSRLLFFRRGCTFHIGGR